jgi:hypothetical protein
MSGQGSDPMEDAVVIHGRRVYDLQSLEMQEHPRNHGVRGLR